MRAAKPSVGVLNNGLKGRNISENWLLHQYPKFLWWLCQETALQTINLQTQFKSLKKVTVWKQQNSTMKAWCLHPIKILLNQVVGKAIMPFFFYSITKNMLYSICPIGKQVLQINLPHELQIGKCRACKICSTVSLSVYAGYLSHMQQSKPWLWNTWMGFNNLSWFLAV